MLREMLYSEDASESDGISHFQFVSYSYIFLSKILMDVGRWCSKIKTTDSIEVKFSSKCYVSKAESGNAISLYQSSYCFRLKGHAEITG